MEPKTKHTPGPWHTIQSYNPEKAVIAASPYVLDSRKEIVASAHMNVPESERQANANLIAAAPDLYAALHAIFYADEDDDHEDLMAAADAALAKARAAPRPEGGR